MTIKTKHISVLAVLLALWTMVLPLAAKKPKAPDVQPLSIEQEQQFAYYWYAVKQAITEERYTDAYALLEFCTMIKPEDGQTLYFLGVIYQGLGQMERAYKTFEKAYSVQPKGTASEDLLEQLKRFYLADSQGDRPIFGNRPDEYAFSAFPLGVDGENESKAQSVIRHVRPHFSFGSVQPDAAQ